MVLDHFFSLSFIPYLSISDFVSFSLSWNSILFMLVFLHPLGHNPMLPAAACRIMSASREVMRLSPLMSAFAAQRGCDLERDRGVGDAVVMAKVTLASDPLADSHIRVASLFQFT